MATLQFFILLCIPNSRIVTFCTSGQFSLKMYSDVNFTVYTVLNCARISLFEKYKVLVITAGRSQAGII